MQQPKTPELRLILACARAHPTEQDKAAIRQLLDEDVDWTLFAKKALNHSLAGLAGHTLVHVALDKIPSEIANAFRAIVEQTRNRNQVLLNELFQLVDRLTNAGAETISFKGPVLAMAAFGDLGLRGFRDLDILIRDRDLPKALECLDMLGYQRDGNLTPAQFDLIHRLQGQEVIFNAKDIVIEPHTRLTPLKMALSIDYDGLWRRAQRLNVDGKAMLTFAPEDTLIVLAIHGGKELWWDIKWACDVADFIASHPGLDWEAILTRARKQGCGRMLLVATSLARNYLGARVPAQVIAAETADKTVDRIINRIVARWDLDDAGGPPSNKTLSLDRFLLHDGLLRRVSYVIRTWFLPGPEHVTLASLPPSLNFVYIPIALSHDLIALPIYRAYEILRRQTIYLAGVLARSPLAAILSRRLAEQRRTQNNLRPMLAKAERATAANPNNSAAWRVMGDTLAQLGRQQEAISCYDKALLIAPDNNKVWKDRSVAIAALNKQTKGSYPSDEPDFDIETAEGWALRAGYLWYTKSYPDAIEASDCALRLDPNNKLALRIGIESRQNICDWRRRESDKRTAWDSFRAGASILRPITFKQIFDSVEDSAALAHQNKPNENPVSYPSGHRERYRHDKIRIAYLSTDLRSHPVGHTIVGLLEHHDKDRFEITAVSLGPDDNSRVRARIQAAADHFVDVNAMEDDAAAALLREMQIDIAVDLNGLTGQRRTGILARRSAPVQVNYIGYPGTTAAPFIDYLIADPIVIPQEHRGFYSEKVAYLPHCYLPYDPARTGGEKKSSRRDQGLPENGFVFSCFNTFQKISPEIFDVWMRLLQAVEGSVLWLGGCDVPVMSNLRREAAARGVSPERLVFARFEKNGEHHLARLSLADIFLDTMPYNAHSTGNDALWSGLPILTTLGHDFHSRVAASLLEAAGLPELVTASLAEYENLALALAREPQRLTALRDRLVQNRQTAPLFDTRRYTRNLEEIYRTMWHRQQSGLPPESFAVETGP